EQLKKAQEEALRRERLYAFGQLAMGIAHDFNNLLQPILSWSDLMLTNSNELTNIEEVKESFKKIHSAAKYGSEIVNKMRRIYKSSLELEKKKILDLNEIIEEVMELVKGRITGKIQIKKQLCERAMINARKSEIHEMILNLILNAIDAMPDGGILEIITEDKIEEVKLIIRDTGIGMTEEIRQKCLQPFFTTKGEKGTGMGLTMVNNIVTEHGGTLNIESEYKKGTTFVITFKKVG
ncbi:MAG: ATP-binding protein, partial [Chitinispirillaceae bacterium]|nr:ATP-binding protein [Chitinispirillaceae bacterium]